MAIKNTKPFQTNFTLLVDIHPTPKNSFTYLNTLLCSLLKCLKLSICVPNCLVQPSCLQWYWGSLLALWVSFMCSSMLLALRNFLKQNLHGTLLCTLKCHLKFANVPNDFLHKSQMYLPVGP